MNKEHYFDWAATAIPDEDILKEAMDCALQHWANPSSVHEAGIDARHIIEDARSRCSKVLGVKPNTLVFTSGGTESDHIPILSLLQRPNTGSILISNIEHPAIREQAEMMLKCGYKIITVPCNEKGIVEPEMVISKLQDDTTLVCIMAVNNETGAIQPIYEIADAITEHTKGKRRPKFHVDAVQAIGKIPLNISYKGIDSVAISGHKICGPRGIGLLYMANRIEPFLRGGGQEGGIRSGTENLFGIIALTKCIEKYGLITNENFIEQESKTSSFIKNLRTLPYCTIVPATRTDEDKNYSPGVLQASFDNIPGEVMVRALSEKGFYISTGSACSARKLSRPILAAMNISNDVATNAVRFSFSCHSSQQAIDELFITVKEIGNMFNKN